MAKLISKKKVRSKYPSNEVILSKIGEQIRVKRKAKYRSHEDFANEIGIKRGQYHRYEKGANMKLATLCNVLRGLDITFEQFFSGFGRRVRTKVN